MDEVVTERGDDRMIDRHRLDLQTGRSHDERTIIRGGKRAHLRVLGANAAPPPSCATGCSPPASARLIAFGEDGEPLTLDHRRMTVVGRK